MTTILTFCVVNSTRIEQSIQELALGLGIPTSFQQVSARIVKISTSRRT